MSERDSNTTKIETSCLRVVGFCVFCLKEILIQQRLKQNTFTFCHHIHESERDSNTTKIETSLSGTLLSVLPRSERDSNTTKIETCKIISGRPSSILSERDSNTTKIETLAGSLRPAVVGGLKEILIQQRLKQGDGLPPGITEDTSERDSNTTKIETPTAIHYTEPLRV